ncbi:MAG: MFS transporter [Burkholderiaceae bacterium]|nr:MFS transporter [Burkholderiaceae bacterium]
MVFVVFAFAYFLSALIRAITATLSPTLTQEFGLQARDLGLLAGGYFLGFAAMQLPLGHWLDRFGPKKVIICFLSIAVIGCLAFAKASSFYGLLAARMLCGAGVSACLMAPLTGYRRWLAPGSQLRANSWMLMTGSMGMVASTLPVQWLMPLWGWRGIFMALSAMVVLAIGAILWLVPTWGRRADERQQLPSSAPGRQAQRGSYADVWAHPYFRSLVPLGFFCYGGLVAVQTLWATPWMIKVAGYSAAQAATGLFWINVAMLCTFWLWGSINPWLVRRGITTDHLIQRGLPLSFIFLAIIIIAEKATDTPVVSIFEAKNGGAAGHLAVAGVLSPVVSISWVSWAMWALYCVSCTFAALAQPAIGMAFAPEQAGRALSAYNLVIFAGVFVVQWGIGLLIDGFKALGWAEMVAFQSAFGVFLLCCIASYAYFVWAKPDRDS